MHEQRARAARRCRATSSSSTAGLPGPGQDAGVDAPHRGDVRARGRVVDHAVAGQLVGLLAVLAAALAVALAGDGAVAAAHAARAGRARARG